MNNLNMLNGRCSSDLVDQTTCKAISTVEYAICNANAFQYLITVYVLFALYYRMHITQ